MSLLNIGLQAVGIMREKQSDQFEAILKSANSMEDIRKSPPKQITSKKNLFPPCYHQLSLLKVLSVA